MTNTARKATPKPGYLGKSIGLVSSTARAIGVDMGAAMQNGDITALDYARMLQTCNSSGCGMKCQQWRNSPERKDSAPSFCPNHAMFERLKSEG